MRKMTRDYTLMDFLRDTGKKQTREFQPLDV